MQKNPTISVIVSTYNRVKMLERAIQSILKQTFKDFEIIIVDDASTDKTEKYCDKLTKKYDFIRYIKRSANHGKHGKPKNDGIKAAKGTYVCFLDDDNEYLIDHLQALYNEITRNIEIDIVYGDRWVIREENHKEKTKGISSDFNTNLLKQRNYIDTSDFLTKKSVLVSVGGWDEELNKFADWNLFVRLAKYGYRFLHVPKLLTNYYVHEGMNQFKHHSPINQATGGLAPTFNPDLVPIWANQTTFGPEKALRVAIFTLTHDRLEYTKRTLDSLKEFANYPYDHFIIDNKSIDGTVEWLEKNRDKYRIKRLIKNEQNVGISKGSNQALDAIGDDYDVIIKMDNDCEIQTPDFISSIVDVFRRNKRIVISPNVEGLIDNAGGPPRFADGHIGNYLFGFVRHLGGICCAAPREAYTQFRWANEDFLHGMQDTIFSQYCLKAGYAMAYFENLRVMHIDSTYGQKEKYPEYFERRRLEKITKYDVV